MKRDHKLIGLKAKRNGSSWESAMIGLAEIKGWDVIPIPPGCKQLGAKRLIRVKTPFDCVFIKQGKSLYTDLKTTIDSTWPYCHNDWDQIAWLIKCEHQGHKAGYIVNFSELDTVVFFSATSLTGLKPRSSLKPGDGIIIGSTGLDIIYGI